MKKRMKRLLALFLAFVMAMSLLSAGVFAATPQEANKGQSGYDSDGYPTSQAATVSAVQALYRYVPHTGMLVADKQYSHVGEGPYADDTPLPELSQSGWVSTRWEQVDNGCNCGAATAANGYITQHTYDSTSCTRDNFWTKTEEVYEESVAGLVSLVALNDAKYTVGDYVDKSELKVYAIYSTNAGSYTQQSFDEAHPFTAAAFTGITTAGEVGTVTSTSGGMFQAVLLNPASYTLENYILNEAYVEAHNAAAAAESTHAAACKVSYGDNSKTVTSGVPVAFDTAGMTGNGNNTNVEEGTGFGEVTEIPVPTDPDRYPTQGDAAMYNGTAAVARAVYNNALRSIADLTEYDQDSVFQGYGNYYGGYWAGKPGYKVTYHPYNQFTSTGNGKGTAFTWGTEAGGDVLTVNNGFTYYWNTEETPYYGSATPSGYATDVLDDLIIEEAGLYTVQVIVPYAYQQRYYCANHGWDCPYGNSGTTGNWYYWYRTYSFNIVIEQAGLDITNATDTVYASTKVENHMYQSYVTGVNEQVYLEYLYNADESSAQAVDGDKYTSSTTPRTAGENWGNLENIFVNAGNPEQTGIYWEANVYYPKDNNNYLCQYDGASRSEDVVGELGTHAFTKVGDLGGRNTYYSGINGTLLWADSKETDTGAIQANIDVTFTYEKDQKIGGVADTGAAASTATDGTTFGKTASEDANGWAFESEKNPGQIISGVFGEDFQIAWQLNYGDKSVGQHVKVGDRVDHATTYAPSIGANALSAAIAEDPYLVFTATTDATAAATSPKATVDAESEAEANATLNSKEQYKTYDGDWWEVRIYYTTDDNGTPDDRTDDTTVDVVEPYRGQLSDEDDEKALHTWKSDALRACNFYGVENYTVEIIYNGLFYTYETKEEFRDADWDNQEEFNWVYASAVYDFVIAQREVVYKPLNDLHKVYDGTDLLVRQTVAAADASDGSYKKGDVIDAYDYYIDMRTDYSSDTQFTKKPATVLANWQTPGNTTTLTSSKGTESATLLVKDFNGAKVMTADLWLAGSYVKGAGDREAEDANVGKRVVLTEIILADDISETLDTINPDGSSHDYRNFLLVDGKSVLAQGETRDTYGAGSGTWAAYPASQVSSGTEAASASSGTVSAAQMDVTLTWNGVAEYVELIANNKSLDLRKAVGIQLKAMELYLDARAALQHDPAIPALTVGKIESDAYVMADTGLTEKDYAEGNENRYDYDDYYLLLLDDVSQAYVKHPAFKLGDLSYGVSEGGLSINSDTGAIATPALKTSQQIGESYLPQVRVDIRDFRNFLPIDTVETRAALARYSVNANDYDTDKKEHYVGYRSGNPANALLATQDADGKLNYTDAVSGYGWGVYSNNGIGVPVNKIETAPANGPRLSSLDTHADVTTKGGDPDQADQPYKTDINEKWGIGNEFISYTLRYSIEGNDDNYNVYLPVNNLNERSGMGSRFAHSTDGAAAVNGQVYSWLNVYAGYEDGAEFRFTIPQDAYLTDVVILKVDGNLESNLKTYADYVAAIEAGTAVVESKFSDPRNGLKLSLMQTRNDDDSAYAADFMGNDYTYAPGALPEANDQIGGGTFTFRLDTEDRTVGNNYKIVIVPMMEQFDLMDEKAVGFSVNALTQPSEPGVNTSVSFAVGYKLNYDITESQIVLSYPGAAVALTQALEQKAAGADYIVADIGTTNADFFDPTKLLPGTTITMKLMVWRDGVVSDLQTLGADSRHNLEQGIPADSDAYEVVERTHVLTLAEYIALFGDRVLTFAGSVSQDPADILGFAYKADWTGGVNFADVDSFIYQDGETWKVMDNKNLLDDAVTWESGVWDIDGFTTYDEHRAVHNGTAWALTETGWNHDGDVTTAEPDYTATAEVPIAAGHVFYATEWPLTVQVGANGSVTVAGQKLVGETTGDPAVHKTFHVAVPFDSAKATVVIAPDGGYTKDAAKLGEDDFTGKTIGLTDEILSVTFKKQSSAPVGGGTVTPTPTPDPTPTPGKNPIANPDDTGVSKWLITGDHVAYMNGYVDGSFRPTGNITRAEVAAIIYRLIRPEVTVGEAQPYDDVPVGVWYEDAVNTTRALGLINGVGDNRFDPLRSITKGELVTILSRLANASKNDTISFKDVSANYWAYDAIMTAAAYGWINGNGNGQFNPDSAISRVETVEIMNNVLGRLPDADYIAANAVSLKQFNDVKAGYWGYNPIMEATNAHDFKTDFVDEDWTGLK